MITSTSSSSASFGGLYTSGSATIANGLTAAVNARALTYTASGSINRAYGIHVLDGSGSSLTITIDAPVVGEVQYFTCSDATSSAQIQLTAGTFDGSNDTAHFNAAAETLALVGIATDRYAILENVGSVGLD